MLIIFFCISITYALTACKVLQASLKTHRFLVRKKTSHFIEKEYMLKLCAAQEIMKRNLGVLNTCCTSTISDRLLSSHSL